MELEFRGAMTPGLSNHGTLLTPQSPNCDIRNNPRITRPGAGFDFSSRASEPCEMETIPPITGKRRGGSRKACNECKQQKVCMILTGNFSSWVIEFATASM